MKIFGDFNKFNIFSLKDILTTRAYLSSIFNTITNEFIYDGPFTIIQSIENNNENIYSIAVYHKDHSNKIVTSHHLDNIEHIILLILFGLFCMSLKYNQTNYNNNIKRLDNFIEYYEIKKKMNILFTVFIFIFMKNINNAC